jgi:hypothetical protein
MVEGCASNAMVGCGPPVPGVGDPEPPNPESGNRLKNTRTEQKRKKRLVVGMKGAHLRGSPAEMLDSATQVASCCGTAKKKMNSGERKGKLELKTAKEARHLPGPSSGPVDPGRAGQIAII